jgi:hypothetical protein
MAARVKGTRIRRIARKLGVGVGTVLRVTGEAVRPYAVTRSVSRQKIADGHPRSVGSVKNQRIS